MCSVGFFLLFVCMCVCVCVLTANLTSRLSVKPAHSTSCWPLPSTGKWEVSILFSHLLRSVPSFLILIFTIFLFVTIKNFEPD